MKKNTKVECEFCGDKYLGILLQDVPEKYDNYTTLEVALLGLGEERFGVCDVKETDFSNESIPMIRLIQSLKYDLNSKFESLEGKLDELKRQIDDLPFEKKTNSYY